MLTEIKVKEGETVPVNSVVAVIGGEKVAAAAARRPTPSRSARLAAEAAVGQPESREPAASGRRGGQPEAEAEAIDDLRRQKSSPLVRRIANEHNVDIRNINGTGISGRVTKNDILGFIETKPRGPCGARRGRETDRRTFRRSSRATRSRSSR